MKTTKPEPRRRIQLIKIKRQGKVVDTFLINSYVIAKQQAKEVIYG